MVEINTPEIIVGRSDEAVVCVVGSGVCANRIVENLNAEGITVFHCTHQLEEKCAGIDGDRPKEGCIALIDCKGFAGDFTVTLQSGSDRFKKKAHAIVLAEANCWAPNFEDYALEAGGQVLSLSELERRLESDGSASFLAQSQAVAFMNGVIRESQPDITRRMLMACGRIQSESNAQTYFLTNNLKVSADGSQQISDAAKTAGTIFLKSGDNFPSIETGTGQGVHISTHDDLTNMPFAFTADWVVVDETQYAAGGIGALAQALALRQDADGYAQPDNVHYLNHATNRRGIFVAGGARGTGSEESQTRDADHLVLEVLAFLNGQDREPLALVEIDRGRCARCLTCLRLCPHCAVDYEDHVSIAPAACYSCGICAAACPARAIDMRGLHIETELERRFAGAHDDDESNHDPISVIVFGCARSAARALDLAVSMGNRPPSQIHFIEVPCAGAVSQQHMLSAFDRGADGVMLCTCHTDNCRSDEGNLHARRRGEQCLAAIGAAGIEADRFHVTSVAANMGVELIARMAGFTKRIETLAASKAPA